MKDKNQNRIKLTTDYEENRLKWGPVEIVDNYEQEDQTENEKFSKVWLDRLRKMLQEGVQEGSHPDFLDEHTMTDILFI